MRKRQPKDDAPDSDEFFYVTKDGFKDDTELHDPILRAVDYPINEAIMGPIRDRYRRKRFGDAGWNEALHPRDPVGKFTRGGGGEHATTSGHVSNAAALYKAPTKTADELIAEVPGADEAVARARHRLMGVVETDKLVSQGGFKQADGTYTPERAAIHQKIVSEYINEDTIKKFSPEPGEAPLLTILGGRGGSGKGWLTSGETAPIDARKSMVLDSDEIKGKLPEYKGWNAAQLHEEASDIVAMIDRRAGALGLNVVLDGTLKSTSILKRVEVYQATPSHKYEMEGFYMYASPETAARRAMGRFKTKKGDFSGRFVPPEVILGNTKNESNFDAMTPNFRRWAVYDNNEEGRSEPRLVQRGGRLYQRKR